MKDRNFVKEIEKLRTAVLGYDREEVVLYIRELVEYYGQKNEDNSNTKILKVNGIGNGYSNVFYFRRRGGEWKMYKYEDTSI